MTIDSNNLEAGIGSIYDVAHYYIESQMHDPEMDVSVIEALKAINACVTETHVPRELIAVCCAVLNTQFRKHGTLHRMQENGTSTFDYQGIDSMRNILADALHI